MSGNTKLSEPLRDVIARHNIHPTKSLGQHFLLDRNLIRKIVRAAGPLDNKTVLEIGAGPGGLTRELLASSAREVIAIERDKRCIEALNALAQDDPNRLRVIEGDALKVDEYQLIDRTASIVANLPYNIATELFFKWHRRSELFDSLTLMFQKEVADRFTAGPRTKAYGRLAVMAQWRYAVRRMFDVPRDAFVPPPKITSSVVKFTPLPQPIARADPQTLQHVVAVAFGQRRKMLRGALRTLPCDTKLLLSHADIPGNVRAEELSIDDFCALARAFDELSSAKRPH